MVASDKTERKSSMSTNVKTEAKTVTQASAKLTAQVVAMIEAQVGYEGATLSTVRTLQSESSRLGLDKDGSRQLLVLSIRAAKLGKPGGLAKGADDEAVKAFDFAQKFQVSRLLALAFPKAEVAAEVEKALSHDEGKNGSKHGRIGVNKAIEIARGNLTCADAKAGKAPARRNPTPPTPAAADVSPEAFENALAGLRSRFIKPGAFNPERARELAAKVFCDGTYSPAKK
jgi:hypothetical protein